MQLEKNKISITSLITTATKQQKSHNCNSCPCILSPSNFQTYLTYSNRNNYFAAIRLAHTSALKDKCRIAPNSTRKHTDTMGLILDALKPVENSFTLLTSSRGNDLQKQSDIFDYFGIISLPLFSLVRTLKTAIDWLQTKSQQHLSSGTWEQFLIITTEDTVALQERLRAVGPHVINLSKRIHLLEKPTFILESTLESVLQMFGEVKVNIFFFSLSLTRIYLH